MPTVTPLLYKHRTNAEGLHPIYVRVSDANKSRYVSTRLYVSAKDWNPERREVRRSHPEHESMNATIKARVAQLTREIAVRTIDGDSVTADELKRAVGRVRQRRPRRCFFEFSDAVVRGLMHQDQVHWGVKIRSVVTKFEAFAGRPLPFHKITPTLLREFDEYLAKEHKNNANTRSGNLKAIRAVINRAVVEGLLPMAESPFMSYKIPSQRGGKERLTIEEIRRLETLDLADGSLQAIARDAFLFSYYTGGTRFGDMARLTWKNVVDGRLRYRMSKTGRTKNIKLVTKAQAILDCYRTSRSESAPLLPLLKREPESAAEERNIIGSANALFNARLKEVAAKAGIKANLSFHVARHSFADHARQRGASVYDVSAALGHSSIAQTENYLASFDEPGLDSMMEGMFNE